MIQKEMKPGSTGRRRLKKPVLLLTFLFIGLTLLIQGCESKTPDTPGGSLIQLPNPDLDGSVSVERAMYLRKSVRAYEDKPLALHEISQLLWAAQGMSTGKSRTVPSAGGLYPIEACLVVRDVSGLEPGIYRYDPARHGIWLTAAGDRRELLFMASLSQTAVKDAPVCIVLYGVFQRTTSRYGDRGKRYVYMEAGHSAQNIYMQAVSLGLGTVSIGAFDDAQVKEVLGLGKEEEPLYIIPVGKIPG